MAASSHLNSTTTGAGLTIDIRGDTAPSCPPVMHTFGTGVTYDIEGSHDNSNWISYGTFTAPTQRDLVPGVRFWRTNISVNPGTPFTSQVGEVLSPQGNYWQPGIFTGSYSAGM